MELLIKKRASGKFSEIGASAEKRQFGLGYSHKWDILLWPNR